MHTLPDPIDFVPELVSRLRSGPVTDRRTASALLEIAARDHPGSPACACSAGAPEALDDEDVDVRVSAV